MSRIKMTRGHTNKRTKRELLDHCDDAVLDGRNDLHSRKGRKIAEELFHAVVSISSEVVLTTSNPVTPTQELPSDLRTYIVSGNGAFINQHYILTSSALVLVPPSVLANNNRYPFVNDEAYIDGRMPNEVVQASKILVTVSGLVTDPYGESVPGESAICNCSEPCDKNESESESGKCSEDRKCKCNCVCDTCEQDGPEGRKAANGQSVVYQASLVMVDGAGGYALLKIDYSLPWNCGMPKVGKNHPKFEIGESRALNNGDDVYMIGNFAGNLRAPNGPGGFGITKGVVSNKWASDPTGFLLPELVLVDAEAYSSVQGMPIINKCGQLVAIQISNVPGAVRQYSESKSRVVTELPAVGQGAVAGVSEYFFRKGVRAILCCDKAGKKYNRLRSHLRLVEDSLGNYFKYVKGYAGIAYSHLSAADLNTYVRDPLTGAKGVLLNTAGELYNGPEKKALAGVRVLTLAGDNTTPYVNVPGSFAPSPYPTMTQDSNFRECIQPGYFLTSINEYYLGLQDDHANPAQITWALLPGDCVTMVVRPTVYAGPGIASNDNLNGCVEVKAELAEYPAVMDYLWAAINDFPLLADPANVSQGPATVINPQLPALNFNPAF